MTVPELLLDIDFSANATASFADIHTNDDGVVSFWRINSTSTFDDVLNLNDGVLISTPSTTTGPYPYDSDLAVTFDGTNDSAYVLSSASLVPHDAASVDGWFKVAALPASTRDIVAKRGSWVLQLNSSGKLLWTVKDDNSTVTVTSNTTIATGTFYYVACVYDGASALLYINGVLDGSSAYSSGLEIGPLPVRFAATAYTTAATYQSSQTNTGTSTSVTCNAPAGIASGNLLIAHFSHRNSTTWTPPSGWLGLAGEQPVASPSGLASRLYYKIATGSEPASYTWTGDVSGSFAIAITRITGQDSLAPFANLAYSQNQTSSTTSHPTGTHLAAVNNALVLAFFSGRNGATWTEDSGTERYDVPSGDATIAMSSQVQTTPSSLQVTGTSSPATPGCAHFVVVSGSGLDEVAVTLKDWTFWNRGLDADDVARNWESRLSGTAVWVPVQLDLRDGSTFGSAQRQYELDRLEAGGATFTLKDLDFNYDPSNTSSIHYPSNANEAGVIPMRRARVRATHSGTTYDIGRYLIERWPTRRQGVTYQELALTAVDGFALLALAGVSGTLDVGFTGTQIHELLDKALWPEADRAIDAGQYVMEAQTISAGTKALGLIQELADSERGLFFIDAAGVATFHDAAHRGSQTRSTTVQATFSDHPDGGGIVYQGLEPSFDVDKVVNDWTVSPGSSVFGSAAQQVIDHVSKAKYGHRSNSRSTRLATNADALTQAGNLLNETAEPGLRFDSMTVIPQTDYAFGKCLDLRISDRVTLREGYGPNWDGPQIQRDCFVEQKGVTLTDGHIWTFTFQLSPVSAGNYYGTIMRDAPVSYWRLDATT